MNAFLKFLLWLLAIAFIGTALMLFAGVAGMGYLIQLIESSK